VEALKKLVDHKERLGMVLKNRLGREEKQVSRTEPLVRVDNEEAVLALKDRHNRKHATVWNERVV
jgi:hypothetical protein